MNHTVYFLNAQLLCCWGVYYAEPISDVLSAAMATVLFLLNIKKKHPCKKTRKQNNQYGGAGGKQETIK